MNEPDTLASVRGRGRHLVPAFVRDRFLAKFVVTVLVVLPVVSAVGTAGYAQANRTVQRDTEAQMRSTATFQADSIGAWVSDRQSRTRSVSRAGFARETNDGVQEVNDVTERQATATGEVVAMVDDVTTISEETTVEAGTVASAAEEQNAALVETSGNVEEPAGQAARLSEALDRFETDVDGAADEADEIEVP